MTIKENVNGYKEEQYNLDFINHSCMKEIKKEKWLSRAALQFDSFFPFEQYIHYIFNNSDIIFRFEIILSIKI